MQTVPLPLGQLVIGLAQLDIATQDPLIHAFPLPQAFPHAPQLFASVAVSTQVPAHIAVPGEQVHAPAVQATPAMQACPHEPQLDGSVCRFTQAAAAPLPHAVCGLAQEQIPPKHTIPPLQAFPQAPQLRASLVGSTQTPPQHIAPPAQPPEHVPPASMAIPLSLGGPPAPLLLAQPTASEPRTNVPNHPQRRLALTATSYLYR